MKKFIVTFLFLLLVTPAFGATKAVVPRADTEGSIGTAAKTWGAGYLVDHTVTGSMTVVGTLLIPIGTDPPDCGDVTDGAIFQDTDATTGQQLGYCEDGSFTAITGGSGATSLDGLSDVGTSSNTSGNILVADGTNFDSVTISGDITIGSTGIVTIQDDAVQIDDLDASGTANSSTFLRGDGAWATPSGSGADDLGDLSDVGDSSTTSGNLLIADGDSWESVTISGDITIGSTGIVTIQDGAVQLAEVNHIGTSTPTSGNLLIGDGSNFNSVTIGGDITIGSTGLVTVADDSHSHTGVGAGGSNTEIQYNSSGSLDGISQLLYVDPVITLRPEGTLAITGSMTVTGSVNAPNDIGFYFGNSDEARIMYDTSRLIDGVVIKNTKSGDIVQLYSQGGDVHLSVQESGGEIIMSNTAVSKNLRIQPHNIDQETRINSSFDDSVRPLILTATGFIDDDHIKSDIFWEEKPSFCWQSADTDPSTTENGYGCIWKDDDEFRIHVADDAKVYIDQNVQIQPTQNSVALTVTGTTTQTSSLVVIEQSDGTDVFSVANDGDSTMTGTLTLQGLIIPGLDCTGNSNGGALTTNSSGGIGCSDDDSGGGSGTGTVILPIQSAKLSGAFIVDGTMSIDGGKGTWALLADDTGHEYAGWHFRIPADYSSSPVAKIQYTMASATTSDIDLEIDIMCLSDGDSADIDTASFDTINEITGGTNVPATAGYLDEISITLTNNDSMAAGDHCFFRLARDGDDGDDGASGDAEIRNFTFQYSQ